MNFFGANASTINILSQVNQSTPQLELALVLDNTGSMNDIIDASGTRKIDALKTAAGDLTNIIFGSATNLRNLATHLSVVPFDVDVNIGTGNAGWIQTAYAAAVYRLLPPTATATIHPMVSSMPAIPCRFSGIRIFAFPIMKRTFPARTKSILPWHPCSLACIIRAIS